MKGIAISPGSCGELAEGYINEKLLLISCPIKLYSKVTVNLKGKGEKIVGSKNKSKTKSAIIKTLKYFNKSNLGFEYEVVSDIPEGLGMASSSADITAACLATARALGEDINEDDVFKLALNIEPSDGVMYKGVVKIDFINGRSIKKLGDVKPMQILILDLGGKIETIEYYSKNQKNDKKDQYYMNKSFSLVEKGINENDIFLIAKGSTLSAFLNQKKLNKKGLEKLHKLFIDKGALGINIAHSGSVVGVLFPPNTDLNKYEKTVKQLGITRYFKTAITNDGPKIIEGKKQ